MAMSVSPGGRRAPGFCHNRRQGKRSAQKQIICPIYRGFGRSRSYRMGLEPEILSGKLPHRIPPSDELTITPSKAPGTGVLGRGFIGLREMRIGLLTGLREDSRERMIHLELFSGEREQ